MADAIVSALLDQLNSIAQDRMKEKWRLVTGVEQEVGKLTTNLQAIQAVLEDAEQRQMKQDKAVTVWLDQLRDASYDMEDVLEEWTTARLKLQIEGLDDDDALALAPPKKKVCSFFRAASNYLGGFKQLILRDDVAVKISEISEKLDGIATRKDMFKFVENVSNNVKKPERVRTISLIDEGEVCGRVDEKNELLSKLLCESSEQQKGLNVISLVGLGGIGKTTLAQLAYNNDEVKRNFEKVIWVCVSDTFDEMRVAKAIIEGLGESKEASGSSEFQSLMNHISGSIKGKKVFLVLDDVWDGNYDKWQPFFSCLTESDHGSKILVTTRNESVARMMRSTNIISIKPLPEEEFWSLFERFAFFGHSSVDCEKLEPIARQIALKCKGLPLAAKVTRNLLCSKRTGNLLSSKSIVNEWQRILDSEVWKVEEIRQGLLAPLLLSYNDLPSNSMVKRCFSYCVVFPKDGNIYKKELIDLWMAQGYLNAEEDEEMEMIGEEYFNILATRSFFQEFEKDDDDDDIMSCKMHDIVHDFAQFVSRKECLWLEINGTKESVINSFGDKVRHLGLNFQIGASFSMSFFEFDRLRTLLIYDQSFVIPSLNNSILRELFSKLACLRALVIRQLFLPSPHLNFIREIPENIGKLIHLKYLNLSGLCIERLPETLCELYNLQKLDISWCRDLRELPAGIGKLKNMRSLLNGETDSLKYMPVGISKLTSLRTLKKFVVGGGVDGNNTCRLESLKNLQLLRECRVEGLSNVSHVDEAERLQLYNKKNLLRLHLEFGRVVDGDGEEGRRKNEKDKQLLEALQPPLNVEELWIIFYGGNILPKWLTSLTNLRDLKLVFCQNWLQGIVRIIASGSSKPIWF
ncbi:putative disease resistance protein RGA1 [Citrus clementina]|uniref:putative disease resistance protein RGA1 n=1 Tax=Citrus clementina TaxID=85681 RepID=UPI000CED45BF|nr:putative disease resistance protein RGA1 [Citrus x clementina]